MITKSNYTRQEVDYEKLESNIEINSALTVNNEKYILRGKPAIELMANSYKYGEEVQITVYNKIGSTKLSGRVPYATNYDRMELFFKREEFKNLCEEYLKIYNQKKKPMEKKLTEPIEILEWIRNHWTELKSKGTLEIAINKYLKASGETELTAKEVIDIEESANINNLYLK